MKGRFTQNLLLYLLLLVISSLHGFGEGTKELNTNDVESTTLYLCNDFAAHCNTTGGIRSQFATYNATNSAGDNDRLYFTVANTDEVVYLGFKGSGAGINNHIVYQIREKITENVVQVEQSLPTAGTGFIVDFVQAQNGPNQLILPPAIQNGYDAMTFTPPAPGTYYIEFSIKQDLIDQFVTDQFDIDLFDITVANTISQSAKKGRVYSKAWQFLEDVNFYGTNYIISDDSIVTSASFDSFNGGAWVQYCNQTGCGNTNWADDRKSLFNQQAIFPQYKIFLNPPDADLFPFATTLGNIILPAPYGIRNCNGSIDFIVNVDKPGNVEIELNFTPSTYITRTLPKTVTIGTNTISWDGKDNVGVNVPNNVGISFTVRYINGLTNLPLYDVEGNTSGFLVSLVAPAGSPPKIFWDDSNIWDGTCTAPVPPNCFNAGKGTNSLDVKSNITTGCTSPSSFPGCHKWPSSGNGWGNFNTINSWWYTVSTSNTYPPITQWRSPQTLVFQGSPPPICAGTTGVVISVGTDDNTEEYHWSYSGTGVTFSPSNITTSPTVTLTIDVNATSGDISVFGTNTNCSITPGPTSQLSIIILPVPDLTTLPDQSTCSGVAFSIPLTSNPSPPTTTFSWTVSAGDCSPNIQSCPIGTFSGTSITGNLSVTNLSAGTVTYHVTPAVGTCAGTTIPIILTVAPKPNITSPVGPNESLCDNESTNINLQSSFPTATINWLVQSGSCNNILNCPTSGVGGPIVNLLDLLNPTIPGSVVYTITPSVGGCFGDPVTYTVNVNPLPDIQLAAFGPVCIDIPPFVLTGGSPSGGVYTLGGVPVTFFDPAAAGVGTHTITYSYTNLQGCSNLPATQQITVNPVPTATISGTTAVCKNAPSPQITFTGGGATAPYIFTYNINGGLNQTVTSVGDIGTVTAPTNISGSYIYNLVSVQDGSTTACLKALAGLSATVVVNPLPTATVTGTATVCQNSAFPQVTFTGASGTPPYTFTYNINGGLNQLISAAGNSVSIPVSTATAGTFAYNLVSVTEGSLLACSQAQPMTATVTVNPLPVTTITGTTTACQDFPTQYQYQTSVIEGFPATYSWIVTGASGTLSPSANDNPVNINWNAPGTATLTVNAVSGLGCANSGSASITINPKPAVAFTSCFDLITNKSARRFQLKGGNPPYVLTGIPLQGEYLVTPNTPALTTDVSGNYYFNPSMAAGNLYSISYRYTNFYGCPNTTAPVTLIIQAANPAGCGATMTDPRDGRVYATALLGGRCWMTENLNYNKNNLPLSVATPMANNCVVEKYCPPSDATCAKYGAYYQWNELVQYQNTDVPYQGVCPPGWHIPTETEWQTLIDFIDPAFTAPSANALVGSELKDPSKNFKARLEGIDYQNSALWNFTSGLPLTVSMFWTSTTDGPTRAIARGLNNPYNTSISKYSSSHANAFPVRCLKD